MTGNKYLDERLKEPSSWVGAAVILAGVFGTTISPECQAQMGNFVTAGLGFVAVMLRDKQVK